MIKRTAIQLFMKFPMMLDTCDSKSRYLLHLADDALILGQNLSHWCGHGPILEQDIAISNIALDLFNVFVCLCCKSWGAGGLGLVVLHRIVINLSRRWAGTEELAHSRHGDST